MTYQITVDCQSPPVLARFWAEALPSYEVQPPPDGFDSWRAYWASVGIPEEELGSDEDWVDSIVSPDGPRVWFQEVPEVKSIKNRLHFDLLVGGGRTVPIGDRRTRVRAEAERLVEFGASITREMDSPDFDHFAIAMTDPEGNEFDIV